MDINVLTIRVGELSLTGLHCETQQVLLWGKGGGLKICSEIKS